MFTQFYLFRFVLPLTIPFQYTPGPSCTSSNATGMISSYWYLFDQVIPFEINGADTSFKGDGRVVLRFSFFPFLSSLIRVYQLLYFHCKLKFVFHFSSRFRNPGHQASWFSSAPFWLITRGWSAPNREPFKLYWHLFQVEGQETDSAWLRFKGESLHRIDQLRTKLEQKV